MSLLPKLAVLLGAIVAAGVLTRPDWELRIGSTGGRLHWSLEKGPVNEKPGEPRTAAWCAACEPRRFARSGLVVCRGCRAAAGATSSRPALPSQAPQPKRKSSRPRSAWLKPKPAPEVAAEADVTRSAAVIIAVTVLGLILALACRSPAKPIPRSKPARPDRQSVVAHRLDSSGDELAVALAKAKARALGAQEAQAASTDEDETEPVAKARQSIFGNFAIPDLRSRVAAKVTAEAQAAPTDENETEAVGRARKSVYSNFALPDLRSKVAAKVTTQARPAQADRNSVVYGSGATPRTPGPVLATQLSSLAETSEL